LVLATPITLVQFYMQRFIVYGMAAGAERVKTIYFDIGAIHRGNPFCIDF